MFPNGNQCFLPKCASRCNEKRLQRRWSVSGTEKLLFLNENLRFLSKCASRCNGKRLREAPLETRAKTKRRRKTRTETRTRTGTRTIKTTTATTTARFYGYLLPSLENVQKNGSRGIPIPETVNQKPSNPPRAWRRRSLAVS